MRFRDMSKLPLVMIAAVAGLGAWLYPSLPDRVPVHWGISGGIDGWAARSPAAVFIPTIAALVVYALFWVMPYLDPRRANLLAARRVYGLLLDLVIGLLASLQVAMLMAARNPEVPVARVVAVAVCLILIAFGHNLGKVKPNWTLGVRLPWTLADDRVWAKGNSFGGKALMVAGALGLLGMLLPPPYDFVALVAPMLAALAATSVYSWQQYRQLHPER